MPETLVEKMRSAEVNPGMSTPKANMSHRTQMITSTPSVVVERLRETPNRSLKPLVLEAFNLIAERCRFSRLFFLCAELSVFMFFLQSFHEGFNIGQNV